MCPMHALCPLPSTLCPLCGPVGWCLRFAPAPVCVCSYVLLLCSALCCLLLLLLQSVALCCHLTTCEGLVCVCLFIRTKMAKCAPMCSIVFLIRIRGIKFNVRALLNIAFARRSWVGAPSFGCDHNICLFFTFFLSSTDPPQ